MAWLELTDPSVLTNVGGGVPAMLLLLGAGAAAAALALRSGPDHEHPERPDGSGEAVVDPSQRLVSACCVQYTMEILDSVDTPLWVGGEEGMCSFANKAWRDFRGTFFGDELGDGWLEGVHPEDRTRLSEEHARAIADKRKYEIQYRLQRADGVYVTVRQKAVPCVYGPARKFFLVCTCVPQTQAVAAALPDPELMLRRLPVPVVKRRVEGMCGVAFLNERSMELLGMPANIPPAVAGEAFDSMIHPDDLPNVRRALRAAVESGTAYSVEYRLIDARDKQRFVCELGDAVKDQSGSLLGIEGVLIDETEKRSAEQSLRRFTDDLFEVKNALEAQAVELASRNAALDEARRAAENATRARTDILANISHEIRTPLTAVLGFAEIASDPTISETRRTEAMRTIRQNGDHLIALIDDVLDLSKIESGRMAIEVSDVSPVGAVETVIAALLPRARGKHIDLKAEYEWPLPSFVRCDAGRLGQIIHNLAGNAVKFTEKGAVLVRVRRAGERILFEVRDTGIGMNEHQVARLFQPFVQADGTMTRKYGGTGLGLAISQRLAAMMQGDITVTSAPGQGSVFTLELPLAAGTPEVRSLAEAVGHTPRRGPRKAGHVSLEGARILLAEDGIDNQRLISFLLRKAGASVDVVDTGVRVVETAVTSDRAGTPYDVVLMDMQMPELDGYGATAALRQCGIRTPIIALTANAVAGDREKCLAAGCDDYLTKPIDRAVLIGTCAAWRAARGGEDARAA